MKGNIIFNLVYQVLLVAVPLITTPYVSRILQADKIGEYSFAQSIVSYFVILATLGTGYYAQRLVAYNKTDIKARNNIFNSIVMLRFLTTCIMFLLFLLFVVPSAENKLLYLIAALEIISVSVDISWFFQGIEEFGVIAGCNGICKVVGALLIFVFVNDRNHLCRYVFFLLGSTLVGNVLTWFCLKRRVTLKRIKFTNTFTHIIPSIKLFASQVAIQIYTVLDKTMIGIILKSDFENGYYEQSQKIIKALLAIVTSIGTVIASRVAVLWSIGKKKEAYSMIYMSFYVLYLVSFPMVVGITIISHRIVPLYLGEGYEKVISLLQIFSFLLPIIGSSNILGIQLLIPSKRERWLTYSVITGALINFIMNLFMIPKYGVVGAAISSVLAEVCVVIVQMFVLKNELQYKKIFLPGVKYLTLSVLMGTITVFFDNRLLNNTVSNLVIIVLCSIISYAFLLFVTKDELLKLLRYKNTIFSERDER